MAFLNNFAIVSCANGGMPRTIYALENSTTETFKKGQLVYLHTDGTVTECADDPTIIAGIAQADAIGSATNEIPIEIIQAGDILRCHYIGTAVPGVSYGIEADYTGHSDSHVLLVAETTVVNFTVLEIEDATNGIALVVPAISDNQTARFQFA